VNKTSLHYASELGHEDIVNILLAHHADANILDVTHSSPLHYVCHKGYITIAESLLHNCKDIVLYKNKFDITPLFYACGHHSLKLVQMLIKGHEKDVDTVNVDGFTALQHACVVGDCAIVQFLLENGANMYVVNKDGYNAFSHAIYNGRLNVLLLLLKRSVLKPNQSMLVFYYVIVAVVVCGIAMVCARYFE
jgi:ankyrin repeat protein